MRKTIERLINQKVILEKYLKPNELQVINNNASLKSLKELNNNTLSTTTSLIKNHNLSKKVTF